jgi:hypothetical protein
MEKGRLHRLLTRVSKSKVISNDHFAKIFEEYCVECRVFTISSECKDLFVKICITMLRQQKCPDLIEQLRAKITIPYQIDQILSNFNNGQKSKINFLDPRLQLLRYHCAQRKSLYLYNKNFQCAPTSVNDLFQDVVLFCDILQVRFSPLHRKLFLTEMEKVKQEQLNIYFWRLDDLCTEFLEECIL